MTFTAMLITNAALAAALLGGLAYVMSRAAKLTPHRRGASGNSWLLRRPLRNAGHARAERTPARRLDPAFDRR